MLVIAASSLSSGRSIAVLRSIIIPTCNKKRWIRGVNVGSRSDGEAVQTQHLMGVLLSHQESMESMSFKSRHNETSHIDYTAINVEKKSELLIQPQVSIS